jgi:hypothetical protein
MPQPISNHGREGARTAELSIACTLEAREGAARLIRWKTLLERSSLKINRESGQIVSAIYGLGRVAWPGRRSGFSGPRSGSARLCERGRVRERRQRRVAVCF